MRVGFVADVHIKLGQKSVPTEWASNRFARLIALLRQHTDDVDVWVIGGDVFDAIPKVEELQIFFDMVSSFDKPTIIYDGNHEALKKGTTFLTYLKRAVNRLNPQVRIIDDYHTEWGIDFIPYCRLKQFAKGECPEFTSRICASHFRGEIPPHVKPEIELELFDRWDVVLAGDLHSYENSQRNILYPGAPVTTSFHRSFVDTGFIILDTDTLKHTWVKLDVPQLIRKTVKAGDDMSATEYHHTIYEVEGDMVELGAMADNALVDKKIVKRESDTQLILGANMSIADELLEYLRFILTLDEKTIERVLGEFNATSNSV